MDRESTGRRIKAARTLTGLTVPQLAERLDLPGLGAKTLGSIERGERGLRPQELAPLARALDVPERFLTHGLDRDGAGEDRDITAALAAFCTAIRAQNDLLDRQSSILERIEARLSTEHAAQVNAEDARTHLLEAAEAASRTLADATRRLEAARGTQAK